jgi:hypothetical protein
MWGHSSQNIIFSSYEKCLENANYYKCFSKRQLLMTIYVFVSCVCRIAVEIKGPKDQTQWQNHLNWTNRKQWHKNKSFMLYIPNSSLTHQSKSGHIGQTCSIQRINKKNKQNCVWKASCNKAIICSCEEYVSLVLSPTCILICCIKRKDM